MSKARVTELEMLLEDCQKFLELVPLMAIQRGLVWYPSEEAIQLGLRAKDGLDRYSQKLLHRTRNS